MKKRLVDADKLMERAKMNSVLFTVEHDHHDYGLTLGALNKIVKECELPSAQPERKRGRWLPDNRPGGGFWVCSCCKFPSEAFAADKLYKYCPVCGCRMDEGD